jgi:hypothetical protein
MIQICEALAHAHANEIIHRDMKPSNLFFLEDHRAKVLDFGIARLPSSRLTVAGKILGTPNYMAPEQILGKGSDARADLFSTAVVFFELLTFVHPFRSPMIPRRIAEGTPDTLLEHDSRLPSALEAVITRGLAKDADQRYQSALEFAADLRRILDRVIHNAPSGGVFPDYAVAVPSAASSAFPGSNRAAQPDEDLKDRGLSEALRLLGAFDSAVAQNEREKARTLLAELEALDAADGRFSESVQLCRARVAEFSEEPDAAVTPAADHRSRDAGSEPWPGQPAGNGSRAVDFTAPKEEKLPQPKRTGSFAAAGNVWIKAVRDRGYKRQHVLLAAGLAVIGSVSAISMWYLLRPVPLAEADATAIVKANAAYIYKSPSSEADAITAAPQGTRLNVLRVPRSRDQQWVYVQFASHEKRFRPGYVRMADLHQWDSTTASVALDLAWNLRPGEAGTDADIEAQLAALARVAAQFKEQPAGRDARVYAAGLWVELAHRKKARGERREVWEQDATEAKGQLAAAGSDPSRPRRVGDIEQRLLALMDDPLSETPDARELLKNALRLRGEYKYDEAERAVLRVLEAAPRNPEANRLLMEIRGAKELQPFPR